MYEACIQNFLNVCDPRYVERHSDSSDFETPSIIPVVTSKDGNHSLLKGKVQKCIAEKDNNNDHLLRENTRTYERHLIQYTKTKAYDDKSIKNTTNIDTNNNKYKNLDNALKKEDRRNRGDQKGSSSEGNSKSLLKNKILPCLSIILRRTSNSRKPLNSTDNNLKNATPCGKNKLSNSNCNQKQKNKHKKRCYNKVTQPVYNVKDIHGFPLLLNETYKASKRKDNKTRKLPSISCSESSISTSEKEVKSFKYDKNCQRPKMLPKCISKENYSKGENTRDKKSNYGKEQQFNIESRIKKPYQIFTSSCQADVCCNSKCVSAELGLSKLESDSSVFWNFLVDKLCKKYPTKKLDNSNICECSKPLPCTPKTCKLKDNSMITEGFHEPEFNLTNRNLPPISPVNSPPRVAPPQIPSGRNVPLIRPSHSSQSVKSSKEEKVECQCYLNKRKKNMSSSKEMLRPCQEEHDVVTKAVADKYHGEILCVHNPQCILINGCLNMPPPHNMGQSNFWPVTQHKKSNFVQMCRKMKRSKQKNCEQVSQYNPPYAELEQCLPEFKTEKTVQSVCNHEPACQYTRSCHKPQFHPELINSCIHVPMCENLEQTVIEEKPEKLNLCTHEPKRKERSAPLCPRRRIMVTANKNTGTQAKTKMVCQHDPPCLRIPTCLAQMICMDNNPFEIRPRCLHNPRCETIATCLKKVGREYIVPVTSQNSSTSCRIV